MQCGMEIRSYSLSSHSEYTKTELLSRCVKILSAPIPYNPKVDLVLNDLKVTPAVIAAIDRAWSSPTSLGKELLYTIDYNIINVFSQYSVTSY